MVAWPAFVDLVGEGQHLHEPLPRAAGPDRDERVAWDVVYAGRQRREQVVAVLCAEPAIREPWLRDLVNEIRG
ncbi:MAG: hypothetical protein HOY78_21380 [Saccharothrix sp.]|nr:hypothetical protein [Saccharothrix sp.]